MIPPMGEGGRVGNNLPEEGDPASTGKDGLYPKDSTLGTLKSGSREWKSR